MKALAKKFSPSKWVPCRKSDAATREAGLIPSAGREDALPAGHGIGLHAQTGRIAAQLHALQAQERLLQRAAEEREMEDLANAIAQSKAATGSRLPGRSQSEELAVALAESLQDAPAHAESDLGGQTASSSSAPAQGPQQGRPPPGDETILAERRALEQLSVLVATCLESNTRFVDPDFAPSPKILYANGRCRKAEADQLLIVQHYERQHGRDVHWCRPGEILQRPDDLMMTFQSQQEMIHTMHQISRIVDWRVFQSDPNPTDISQGALGNCWFCGSLAAVAEKPKLVKRLFVDDNSRHGELNPVGVYLVRLCDGGEWRFVTLDDHFPCNQSMMLAYSGARRNQLWVPLVEKAFAKLRGCYEATEGGNPNEGLRLLTGWPNIVLHLQAKEREDASPSAAEQAMRVQANCTVTDEELLWVRLVSARDADLIMCGSCGHVDGLTKEMYREAGLSPSHCYSIVHVAAAKNGSLRLVQVRNPWGTGLKWRGAFSDDDALNWTDAVKAEVGAVDLGQDGGIFWMTLQDLRRYFNSITICPYRDGWSDQRYTSTFPATTHGPQPGFFLGWPSRSKTEALLSLMQPEERQTSTTMMADLGLVLFRVRADEAPGQDAGEPFGSTAGARGRLEFVDSSLRQVHETLLCDGFIESKSGSAGLVAIPLSFNQRAPAVGAQGDAGVAAKRFTFSCFSAHAIPMKPLELAPELVRDALVAHVRRHGTVACQRSGMKLWRLTEAGMVLYLENASEHFAELCMELTALFNVAVSRGVEADAHGELYMRSRDLVPPMHGMLVLVAAARPGGHNYRFKSQVAPKAGDLDGQPQHAPPLAEPVDILHNPFFITADLDPLTTRL